MTLVSAEDDARLLAAEEANKKDLFVGYDMAPDGMQPVEPGIIENISQSKWIAAILLCLVSAALTYGAVKLFSPEPPTPSYPMPSNTNGPGGPIGDGAYEGQPIVPPPNPNPGGLQQPANPLNPANPANPNNPATPSNPVNPGNPVQPAPPQQPSKPVPKPAPPKPAQRVIDPKFDVSDSTKLADFLAKGKGDFLFTHAGVPGECQVMIFWNEYFLGKYGLGRSDLSYPQGIAEYGNNENVTWRYEIACSTEIALQVKVDVDVETEPGYDYFTLLHGAEHFVDAPIGLTGKTKKQFTYFITPQCSELDQQYIGCKKLPGTKPGINGFISLQFRSDESQTAQGLKRLRISVAKDVGKWTKPTCFTVKPPKRTSFWDGRCGIGLEQRSRKCPVGKKDIWEEVCSNMTIPPRYCIKSKCEFSVNTGMSCEGVNYCWNRDNATEVMNGHDRHDPHFPNPYRVYRSLRDNFNLDEIHTRLKKLLQDAADYYPKDIAFLNPALNIKQRPMEAEAYQGPYQDSEMSRKDIGVRLLQKLLLGDTFVAMFTGASVVAGHDNMLLSTYPYQVQSVLRPLFTELGYKGAAFQSKNLGVGSTSSFSASFYFRPMSGEDAPADIWFWNACMMDGRSVTIKYNYLYYKVAVHKGAMMAAYCLTGACRSEGPLKWGQSMRILFDHECVRKIPRLAMGSSLVSHVCMSQFYHPHFQNWHPAPLGMRIGTDAIVREFLGSVVRFLDKNKALLKKLAPDGKPTKELVDFLQSQRATGGLEKWKDEWEKGCTFCDLPGKGVIPRTFSPFHPDMFNVNRKLQDYFSGDFEVSKMGERNPGHVDSRLGEQGSDDSKDKILVHSVANMTLKWPPNAQGYVRISSAEKAKKDGGIADQLHFYIDTLKNRVACNPTDAQNGVTVCEFVVKDYAKNPKEHVLHIEVIDKTKVPGIGFISLF